MRLHYAYTKRSSTQCVGEKLAMFKKAINNSRARKGFVAVTFAAMATVLVGFSGMAVDAGYMQWNKRRLQMAADAAAMGALRELEKSRSGDVLVNAGRYVAGLNGFTNGSNGVTVAISNPPTSGSFAGNTNAVQSRITRTFPTLFMRIFGQNSVSITALATAHTTVTAGSIGGCIFALNPTMSGAITITGTVNINLNCSVVDESTSASAYSMVGNAYLNLGSGSKVGVVGGYSLSGGAAIYDTRTTPYTRMNPIQIQSPGDPFAAMPEPSSNPSDPGYVGSLPIRVASGGVTYSKNNAPANNTIQPGIYCGGIKLGNTNGVSFTFAPGIYILAGGGLDVGSQALANGTNVMFYATQGGSWGCPNSSYAGLTMTGQGALHFVAPTSGPFVGMLFFQDRVHNVSGDSKVVGGTGSTWDGAIYFKTTGVKYAGNSTSNGYTVLVADNITINGTSTIGNNYTTLSQPNPFAPYTTGGGLAE